MSNTATDALISDIAGLQQAEDSLEALRYHGTHRGTARKALLAAINVINEERRALQSEYDESLAAAERRAFEAISAPSWAADQSRHPLFPEQFDEVVWSDPEFSN